MKKAILIMVLIFLALIPIAFSELTCDDTDGGPAVENKPLPFIAIGGTVKTPDDQKGDYCVRREGKDGLEQESLWIKEYYCYAGDVKSKDYQCLTYGYTKCKMENGLGACVNKISDWDDGTSSENETLDTDCGNKVVEGNEDCDPPGKLCVAKNGDPGSCTDFCICVSYFTDSNETNESKESFEEINLSLINGKINKTEDSDIAISEETKKVLEDMENGEPLKLNETVGIKLTRSVTEGVKNFFIWIANLFR